MTATSSHCHVQCAACPARPMPLPGGPGRGAVTPVPATGAPVQGHVLGSGSSLPTAHDLSSLVRARSHGPRRSCCFIARSPKRGNEIQPRWSCAQLRGGVSAHASHPPSARTQPRAAMMPGRFGGRLCGSRAREVKFSRRPRRVGAASRRPATASWPLVAGQPPGDLRWMEPAFQPWRRRRY